MKNDRNQGMYAIAAAIVVVGALTLGVPVGTLALFGLIVAAVVFHRTTEHRATLSS